ncbi:MAG: hypothetical protein HQK52_23455 [Oligoflexia bacterium]|nr:hypothetical protein [Oligoflexia bacterium]
MIRKLKIKYGNAPRFIFHKDLLLPSKIDPDSTLFILVTELKKTGKLLDSGHVGIQVIKNSNNEWSIALGKLIE